MVPIMWKVSSGLFLGWSLGANDTANVFGTGVATGAVTYRTAVCLTAGFVLLGAFLEGPKCMNIVGALSRIGTLDAFVCALAAAVTMTVLTFLGLPASTSHAIVGAVTGIGILSGSADFEKLYLIVICWVLTPVGGIVAAYLLQRLLSYVLDLSVPSLTLRNLIYSAGIIISGCYAAYSLGGNNVANVTGVYVSAGMLSVQDATLLGGLSIAAGTLTYSRKVMLSVGKGIVALDPFSAMVAVLAEAVTLHVFTQLGVPVSSSQAVVGAVVGVGLVGDSRTVSASMLVRIGAGWISTPVAAGLIAVLLVKLHGAITGGMRFF